MREIFESNHKHPPVLSYSYFREMSTMLHDFDPNEEDDFEGDATDVRKRPLDLDKENFGEDAEQLKGMGGGDGDDEPVLKMKERKQRISLNEAVLTNRDGLVRVYQDFPDSCEFKGKGREAQDAKKIMNKFKEWGFQLFPSLAFPDLINRCESLGSKAPVRAYMENMRERERCRYLNEVLDVSLSDILAPTGASAALPSVANRTSPKTGSLYPPSRTVGGTHRITEEEDEEEDERLVHGISNTADKEDQEGNVVTREHIEIDDAMFLAMAAEGEELFNTQVPTAQSSSILTVGAGEELVVDIAEVDQGSKKQDVVEESKNDEDEGGTQEQLVMGLSEGTQEEEEAEL